MNDEWRGEKKMLSLSKDEQWRLNSISFQSQPKYSVDPAAQSNQSAKKYWWDFYMAI